MLNSVVFRKYFLPGFVFQSVVIAGGYGTGRELAEFFLPYGPLGGLIAMLGVSTVIWSAVCAASFEFSRFFKSYDYRQYFKQLLGKAGFLYEVIYFPFLMIVLAVIAAAAGTILQELFGAPYAVGVVGMMMAVGVLVFRGSATIERFLAGWSFVLYGMYLVFFLFCFAQFGDAIVSNLTSIEVGRGWFVGGVKYASYNLALIPAIPFCLRHIETRKEAVTAGILAGPIAIFPGFLFYLCMAGQYPGIVDRPIPANYLLDLLGSRPLQIAFQAVLFGTLIETGTGMIHGVNERIAGAFKDRNDSMPPTLRPLVAIGLLLMGTILSLFGIIPLIAKGYGTMTWGFLIIFVIPILTLGVWKLTHSKAEATT